MIKEKCTFWAERVWYGKIHPLRYLLLPFSAIFFVVATLNRRHLLRSRPVPSGLPVIVVGNLVVGGSGKTPLVMAIANRLRSRGYKPGIVSRGYGAKQHRYPYLVRTDDVDEAGDESLLLKEKTGCPVVIAADRNRAVEYLAEYADVDVVISDDGLQHSGLHRDMEIALVNGANPFGNGLLLPAGPMREPRSRLRSVDITVINGHYESRDEVIDGLPADRRFSMQMQPVHFQNLVTGKQPSPDAFSGRTVHGCTGIARPWRFFEQLRALGMRVIEHAYPDHHRYRERDICFEPEMPVIVTEKDAVKCRRFENNNVWVLQVEAVPEEKFWNSLDKFLTELL